MLRKQKMWGFVKSAVLPAGIVATFLALTSKIAFASSAFLAYDEGYHFGIIKIYSSHLIPFLGKLPAVDNQYGSVARDGSYLYHYLMSFPVRLMDLFGLGESTQIMVLRSFSITFGIVTLYLAYKLARMLGVGKWAAQLVTLGLVITPVFYDLFSQMNYDTMMIPMTLLSILLTIRISRSLRLRKVHVTQVLGLAGLILATSLVKYSYLPIAAAIVMYLAAVLVRSIGVKRFTQEITVSFRKTRLGVTIGMLALVLITGVLWMQRYGVDMAIYHTPHPQCSVVLSVDQCMAYGPWARNYQLHETKNQRPIPEPQQISFTKSWIKQMYLGTFMQTKIKDGSLSFMLYDNLFRASILLLPAGMMLALYAAGTFKRIRTQWLPILGIGALYGTVLFVQNYADYTSFHMFIAVQARYALPFLPFVYAFAAYGFTSIAMLVPRSQLQGFIAALLAQRRATREESVEDAYALTYDMTPIK